MFEVPGGERGEGRVNEALGRRGLKSFGSRTRRGGGGGLKGGLEGGGWFVGRFGGGWREEAGGGLMEV